MRKKMLTHLSTKLLIGVLLSVSFKAVQADSKVILFVNAEVVTLDPSYSSVDAVLVRDGIIEKVGKQADFNKNNEGNYSKVDLDGATLLPGFIDAHGHLSMTMLTQGMTNVSSPPVGSVESIDDLVEILTPVAEQKIEDEWIIGYGYDDSLLQEQRHPTRFDLDKVSTKQPVALLHVSGHFLTCNSRCLELAGITAETEDPPGGVIRRAKGRQPNGVLEETSMLKVHVVLPKANNATKQVLLNRAQKYYASFGITTVQDGATQPDDLAFYRQASENGQLWLDVVAYPYSVFYADTLDQVRSEPNYKNHFRVGGMKMVLDGSPQGKTAWLTKPYFHPPHGQSENYSGYPILSDELLEKNVKLAFKNGTQLIAHANGDAASDQLLTAVRQANKEFGEADRRTVMIHAQTVREDQIVQMKELGMMPSYFSAHTFYWGDWHRDSVFGVERAKRISPMQSSLDKGLTFTTHNDAPVVPPDMLRLMWSSVNRLTRSEQVLGAEQRITAEQALRSITLDAAYQYFEESSKGSISPGKLADLVVLSANPLNVDPVKIKDIRVLKTYKQGVEVYSESP